MGKASDQLVDIIREMVRDEIAKNGGVVLCKVKEQTDSDHYNLIVVPDEDNVIHNVPNMTKFDLKANDYVYVYKINGQLSNSFITYKVLPK